MIIICCVCKKKIGEKAPLKSKLISHSYCKKCGKEVEEEIQGCNPISPQVELLATTSIDLIKK